MGTLSIFLWYFYYKNMYSWIENKQLNKNFLLWGNILNIVVLIYFRSFSIFILPLVILNFYASLTG